MSSINLTPLSGWTLGTGLEYTTVNGVPTIRHSRLFDDFNDASLDPALWGSVASGTGAITETRGVLSRTLAGSDTAFIYSLTPFLRTDAGRVFTVEFERTGGGTQASYVINVIRVNTAPTGQTVSSTSQLFGIAVDNAGAVMLVRVSNVGGARFEYWTGAAWQVGFTTFGTITTNVVYKYELTLTATTWQIIIRNYDNTAAITGPVSLLSDLTAKTTDEWLCIGDTANNFAFGSARALAIYNAYTTTAITATMPSIAVARTIDALDIVESNETGASFTWGYDIGSGLVSGLTLAQLQAALIGTNPATLSLVATMTALANARASFALDGIILAGYSNIVANTISNATIVSRTNRKVISL